MKVCRFYPVALILGCSLIGTQWGCDNDDGDDDDITQGDDGG